MNVYITKLNGMSAMSTGQYIQHMTANIAHTLGIREMGITDTMRTARAQNTVHADWTGSLRASMPGTLSYASFQPGTGWNLSGHW